MKDYWGDRITQDPAKEIASRLNDTDFILDEVSQILPVGRIPASRNPNFDIHVEGNVGEAFTVEKASCNTVFIAFETPYNDNYVAEIMLSGNNKTSNNRYHLTLFHATELMTLGLAYIDGFADGDFNLNEIQIYHDISSLRRGAMNVISIRIDTTDDKTVYARGMLNGRRAVKKETTTALYNNQTTKWSFGNIGHGIKSIHNSPVTNMAIGEILVVSGQISDYRMDKIHRNIMKKMDQRRRAYYRQWHI